MQAFIESMGKIAQIDELVKKNKDFTSISTTLKITTQASLGCSCER